MSGSTVLYEVSEDCVLTKKFLEFAPDEPVEVTSFLKDKSMACPYQKGQYPVEFSQNLIGGINQCSGNLTTALYELELAVADLDNTEEPIR